MKKILAVMIIILLVAEQSFAQSSKHKIYFSSINSLGTVTGENGSGITLQSINGIKIKNSWAVGLGVGYDPYQVSSIPVFIDVRKYIGKKIWQPFVYIDGGLNCTLRNNNYPKKWSNGTNEYVFKPSVYEDFGIGISKRISTTARFFMSAGYSVKQFKYYQYGYGGVVYNPPSSPNLYNFNYQRWSIQLGLEL